MSVIESSTLTNVLGLVLDCLFSLYGRASGAYWRSQRRDAEVACQKAEAAEAQAAHEVGLLVRRLEEAQARAEHCVAHRERCHEERAWLD